MNIQRLTRIAKHLPIIQDSRVLRKVKKALEERLAKASFPTEPMPEGVLQTNGKYLKVPDSVWTEVPNHRPIELVSFYPEFVWYYPKCEMRTKEWFVQNVADDWTIFDIGANIGYYSVLFAELAPKGRVHAFEPTQTYEMLKRNLNHNKITNCTAHNIGMGLATGRHTDGIFRLWGSDPERLEYDFMTVDDFVRAQNIDRLDCLKIDVDSFDFEVLKGAEATLERFNPWVVVELNHALNKRGQNNTDALEWLANRGYDKALVLESDNFVLRRGERPFLPKTPTIELGFQYL